MYEQLGNAVCRKAEMKDLPNMYNLISPYITEEYDQRKLRKYLKYYINLNSSVVIEDDNSIVGLYAGRGDFIHYFICKGGPRATLLLFYTVLCGIHNKYLSSYFDAFESNIEVFKNLRTPEGKACIIDNETKRGEVPPVSKKYIEQLYRRFKNE